MKQSKKFYLVLSILFISNLLVVCGADAGILPKGTEFKAALVSPLIWSDLHEGSSFSLKLVEKPVMVNHQLLIPVNSIFRGRVLKKFSTTSKLRHLILSIHKLELPNGHKYPFQASLAMSSGGKRHSNSVLARVLDNRNKPLPNLTVANMKDEKFFLVRKKSRLNLPAGTVFILNVGKAVNIPPTIVKSPPTAKQAEKIIKTIQFRNGKVMHAEFLDYTRETKRFMVRHEGRKKEYKRGKIRFINLLDERVNIPKDVPKVRNDMDTLIMKNGKVLHGYIIDYNEHNMYFDFKIGHDRKNVRLKRIARIYLK